MDDLCSLLFEIIDHCDGCRFEIGFGLLKIVCVFFFQSSYKRNKIGFRKVDFDIPFFEINGVFLRRFFLYIRESPEVSCKRVFQCFFECISYAVFY